jgi:2-polyprenyl-6-methoxyphenol hydroxylase-like FAD-dependent oxidoreductase
VNSAPVDVLVVGAGPTGLTLAAQLASFGTRVRVIDRQADRVHESRALAVQPRSLEVLARLSLADALVGRGNPAVRLQMHAGPRAVEIPLFDLGFDDTAYPFPLFVSQAETEAILNQHLQHAGLTVERGVELIDVRQTPDRVTCSLQTHDGRAEEVGARYVVGCDGAHSAVRTRAGIVFRGAAYPQTFVLADLDVDGLDKGAAHVYVSGAGMLFFFPLGHPAPWRMLAMRPNPGAPPPGEPPSLSELCALADTHTGGILRLRDPVWRSYFRLQHRHAATYHAGRVFLAGDAAHVHSPAGAQGMNTGIQDAWNLGWKLALVGNGTARPELLDTYQAERRPVGRSVVRFTDRAFAIATSANPSSAAPVCNLPRGSSSSPPVSDEAGQPASALSPSSMSPTGTARPARKARPGCCTVLGPVTASPTHRSRSTDIPYASTGHWPSHISSCCLSDRTEPGPPARPTRWSTATAPSSRSAGSVTDRSSASSTTSTATPTGVSASFELTRSPTG